MLKRLVFLFHDYQSGRDSQQNSIEEILRKQLKSQLQRTEGRNDINDFVGYGTAVNIYGDSVTTGGGADANGQMGGTTNTNATYKTDIDLSNGGSITTYGVARPAVAVDNGGDVLILSLIHI